MKFLTTKRILLCSYPLVSSRLPAGILYDFFHSETNVDKFIEFLSLEEKKGKDKFNAKRFSLFKVNGQSYAFIDFKPPSDSILLLSRVFSVITEILVCTYFVRIWNAFPPIPTSRLRDAPRKLSQGWSEDQSIGKNRRLTAIRSMAVAAKGH